MLVTFITVIHVLVCIFLILVILLQAGKDAGMGAAFGGGSQTVFGGRGAGSFLGKVTAICATIFFLTSLSLSFAASYKPSVTNLLGNAPAKQAPAQPAPAPQSVEPAAPQAPASPAPAQDAPAQVPPPPTAPAKN